MKQRIVIIALFLFFISCASTRKAVHTDNGTLTKAEIEFINSSEKMRVFKNDSENDNAVLRAISRKALVNSAVYDVLERKMLASLIEEKGVGIAAPQVGVNRRLVIVQRLDKEEKPFEYYYNPVITEKSGEMIEGWEGCLSVPAGFGKVNRVHDIKIEYDKLNDGKIETVKEQITGFTAVIFQHEIDHLDGILFIDKKCDGDLMPKEEYYEMRKKQEEAEAAANPAKSE
ncbi:MAG TPA: peptide deformylase [bacterium]|nr:peptide deformylase [bacterium]